MKRLFLILILALSFAVGAEARTGDVNGDGEVNIADVNSVIDVILSSAPSADALSAADVNGDGEVNIADVNMIIEKIIN